MVIIIVELSKKDFEKLKNRDPLIFKKLYNEYKNNVFVYLNIKSGGNTMMAEDILSDVFHSALEYCPKLKHSKNLSGWLIMIANNRFADYLRRQYRDRKYSDIVKSDFAAKEHEADYNEKLENDEKTLMLNMALKNLKPVHKDFINMKYLEEKSVKEIAGIVKMNENAVLAKLFRARKALKREIKKLSKDFDIE